MHFIQQSFLLQLLAQTMLHSLWQFAVLVVLYEFLCLLFPRFSAALRHTISGYLLTLGTIFFLLCFFYSYLNSSNKFTIQSAYFSIQQNALNPILISVEKWLFNIGPYCAFLYLLIAIILFVQLIRNWVHANNTTVNSLQKIPVNWKLFVYEKAALLGIQYPISLQLSATATTPQVVGFLKPVMLLPLCCITQLTPLQIETLLIHELAHIKRNDYLINFFTVLASILFFFNPFARRLINHLHSERENACDDLVLQFRYPAREYALALLTLEKSRTGYETLQITASGTKKKQLLHRVQRLLEVSDPRHPNRFIWLNVVVIAFILSLLFFSAPKTVASKTHTIQYTLLLIPALSDSSKIKLAPVHLQTYANVSALIKRPTKTVKQLSALSTKKRVVLVDAGATNTTSNGTKEAAHYLTPSTLEITTDDEVRLRYIRKEQTNDYSYRESTSPQSAIAMGTLTPTQPFIPSSSFSYHYITDSVQRTIDLTTYAAALLLLREKQLAEQEELSLTNAHRTKKERIAALLELKTLLKEESVLIESKSKQLELLKAAFTKYQQTLKLLGKKRVVRL
jgi:beta-lactamase regulating signal transducer with metallopeptidase domain